MKKGFLSFNKSTVDLNFGGCPFCQSTNIILHGKCGHGHRRYLCKNCMKTFSSTYGTIVYRAKIHAGKVRTLMKCLEGGLTMRASALIANVDKMTACLWRRKFISSCQKIKDSSVLSGVVEIDEGYIRVVKKLRRVGKNGKIVPGVCSNQMAIGVGFSRNDGTCVVGLIGQGHPSASDILSFWKDKIKEGSTLVHDDFPGHGLLVKDMKLDDQIYPTRKKGLNHKELEHVNNLCSCVKRYFYCHMAILTSHISGYLSMLQKRMNQLFISLKKRWHYNLADYVLLRNYSPRKALFGH